MTIKAIRQVTRGSQVRLLLAMAAALVLSARGPERVAVLAQGGNPVSIENALPGDADWDVFDVGDPALQGFATNISVNRGETVDFKINTDSSNYTIGIYRLGYYGGAGARKVADVAPSAALPQAQPSCLSDAATGHIDCGNWAVSASWTSTGAVSGIYVAKLTRIDTGGASHIVFIVRDDERKADVVVQTSDTTWQAYNRYGGASTYCAPAGIGVSNAGSAYINACPNRATKVSYNRPFDTRVVSNASWLFSVEYPMVRFLEANGYDVKYWAGVDTDRRGADLVNPALKPKAFLSVGHDEYWSGDQRTRVENARLAGVHLAFFSGNQVYWKTRYESNYRTLVTYKETLAGAKIDPDPAWTGTWRDPRFSPPADGGRPENGLTGTIWTVNSGTSAITVPAAMAGHRFWRNTRVADLTGSDVATLTSETLGYEWNEDLDNGARPAGLMHLSSTTVNGVKKIIDYGTAVATGTATHHMTLYRHASGALVFDAGTIQWSWGLDDTHDGGSSLAHVPDQAIQQSTINLLADMGAQPATLQLGADPTRPLTASAASADVTAPTSVITAPAAGAQVASGDPVTIQGTATDISGVPASVEVSLDGGITWHVAQGASTWSFTGSFGVVGPATIRSRAIDDSGNVEVAGGNVVVNVVAGSCPCTSIWKPTTVPVNPSASDSNAVELGVKFKSDVSGFITGIRFYKGPTNTGTHIGNLWAQNGTLLRSATFTNETATGWQQVNFGTPVPITANTVYVASYHTNVGGYASDGAYFGNAGVDSPPLHAVPSSANGGNGVFRYGPSAFPSTTFNATNYWVDVVFGEATIDTLGPVISQIRTSAIDGSNAVITWKTNEAADSKVEYSTSPTLASPVTLTNAALVTDHSIALTNLTPNATYFFRITSVDGFSNSAVALAPSFTMPGSTLHDSATVDFLAGTPGATTYVSQTGDGEVILSPTAGSEFSGSALPAGWIEVPFQPGGNSIVSDGFLIVDGARVATCVTDGNGVCLFETPESTPSAIFTAPRSLEFVANFSGDRFQHAGLGQTLWSSSEPWAVFSTSNVGSNLFARTNTGGTIVETPLGTATLGSLHKYQIHWQETRIDYYIDDALVASHGASVPGPLRPVAASDFDVFGGTIFVNWMRMSAYAGAGAFESRVFDAGAPVNWAGVYWTGTTPPGTSLAISVRTGDTPTPDGSWSSFAPIAAPGAFTASSRYVQYQADLATTDVTTTPRLEDVIITAAHAPVAVNDAASTPANTSRVFGASGPSSLKFNDTDPDTPLAQLRVVAVSAPAHGTATLNANLSVTYTPAADFTGADSFTYTISDGLLTSTATVSMTVTAGGQPTANPETATVPEDSGANTINVLANDTHTNAGETLTVTGVTQGAHGTVTFTPASVTYTPAANYTGPDSFTYTIADSNGVTASTTVNVTVTSVNDNPVAADDPATVAEDSGANAIDVLGNDNTGPDTGETLSVTGVTQGAHGGVAFTATGVSYTPAGDYNGPDSFTYTIGDGNGGSATAAVNVMVTSVNDNAVANADNATVAEDSGANAIDVLANDNSGPDSGETLSVTGVTQGAHGSVTFTATSVSYTPAANYNGPDTFAYTISDGNGGIAGAAVDVNVTGVDDTTITTVTSSNNPSLFGVPITLTATVAVVAPGAGIPNGAVSFKDGATPIACASGSVLAAPVATCTTSSLPVGTRNITAVYAGAIGFSGSTSAPFAQTISPSASLKITFKVHAMQDGTKKPKVATIPVPNALVKVFATGSSCVGNILAAVSPKKWGVIFDGADGPDGVDGCAPVAVGSYQATGTTDADGNTTIIVPPLALNWSTQYLVIGRATNFDYVKTATSPDPLYSAFPVVSVAAGATQNVPLALIATFNGKIVPGKQAEFFGSYLNIVQPEYMDWTEEQEQYPFVMVAEGSWAVSTNIAPPSGFVPDETSATTAAANETTAVQFTLTDVGSDWTETGVTHVINHLGETKLHTSKVKMFNKRPTKAKTDYWAVVTNSTLNAIPVLHNDVVASPKTLEVTEVTQPANGSVTFTPSGVSYTPNADFSGIDEFTYSIVDSEGVTSTANVKVRVGEKPMIFISDASVEEGNKGTMTKALFTVTLSGVFEIPITFDYSTTDNTAADGSGGVDADYVAAAGTIVFEPGETSKTIAVEVIGDNVYEANEAFTVELSNVLNAQVTWGKGIGSIFNDDPLPVVNASAVSVVEGSDGPVIVEVAVTVTGDFQNPITVGYATVDGSALAGPDYGYESGTLTFERGGAMSQVVPITIVGDTAVEMNETFELRLSNLSNAARGEYGKVTILNDDMPVASIDDRSVVEGYTGTKSLIFTVTLSEPSGSPITVYYTTADGTATASSNDYTANNGTLTFDPGVTTKQIVVSITGDTSGERSETFFVDLSNPANVILEQTRATGTIVNDDTSSWLTTTSADFFAGFLDPGVYVSQTANGELTLAPTLGAEFSGMALPPGWTTEVLDAGGAVTIGDGVATVNGAALLSPTTYGYGRAFEFSATFSGAPDQSVGFGVTGALVSPMAMFVTKADGQLYARTLGPTKTAETLIPGSWFGAAHLFRINWNAGNAQYSINGTLVAQHGTMAWGSTMMKPVVVDSIASDGGIVVDWIRMTPYTASGEFISRVFDAGAPVTWTRLTTSAAVPSGSTMVISYRSGSTPVPDATWEPWTPNAPLSASLTGSSQYFQFTIYMTPNTGGKAPTVSDVTLTYQEQ